MLCGIPLLHSSLARPRHHHRLRKARGPVVNFGAKLCFPCVISIGPRCSWPTARSILALDRMATFHPGLAGCLGYDPATRCAEVRVLHFESTSGSNGASIWSSGAGPAPMRAAMCMSQLATAPTMELRISPNPS